MAREKFRDKTINGRDFRIGLVTSDIGSWIALQMTAGKAADFEVYRQIQGYILSECSLYQMKDGNRIPMKIFADGRWLIPELELEYDLDTVDSLYMEALDFNFTPFFEKRKPKNPATTQGINP